MSDQALATLQDAWRLAMKREQDAFDFYSRLAESTTDAAMKTFFSELAEEETHHKSRLIREYRRLFDTESGPSLADLVAGDAAPDQSGRVAWMEWNEDTFRLAREMDLPILLDIHGVWCHWCHVMDRGTYENPDVASLINAEFIPIRVDTDRRPDINARYNMGGWPTTVILTPAAEVLTGRTYIPPDDMLRLLRQTAEYYHQNRDQLAERLATSEARRSDASTKARAAGPISPVIVEDVAGSIVANFDRTNGGFGDAPKFPLPEALELALSLHYRTVDPQLKRVVELTLTNMATGGIFDQEMGGFFRYSTTADWTVPHFEKMAEDNARLIRLYLEAYQAMGKDLYRQTAQKTIDYVNSSLYDQTHGFFYGSQDADEEYYALARLERESRTAPRVDRTAYTSSNAIMAMAYFEAAVVLEEPAYARQAIRTLDFLWEHCHEDGIGMFRYFDGRPHVPGLLADQVWTARALLHGYQYVGRSAYLKQAIELMDESVYQQYVDEEGVGYIDCVVDANAPGRLKDGLKNIDENAWVAEVSTTLFRLTGEERYQDAAEFALAAFGAGYQGYRHFASAYALVVDHALRPYTTMTVVGDPQQPQTGTLLQAGLAIYVPNRIARVLDPAWDQAEIEQLGLPASDSPIIQICRGDVCAEPVGDPDQVAPAIAALAAS